ncbi:hypothetical protein ACS0TY_005565 [Phlomoides rotata]
MHYENTTTNRIEAHHSALKRMLGNSYGNFKGCWSKTNTLFGASHNAIKQSFEKSVHVAQHKFKSLYDESKKIESGESDPLNFKHYLRQVCGLPYTHEIAEYIECGHAIPLESIDRFWRKLDMEPMLKDDVDVDTGADMDSRFELIIESLQSQYNKSEAPHKRMLLRSAVELANSVTTSMTEPPPKINTCGRPKVGKKNKQSKKEASTKRDPSLFEYKESVVASCSIKVIHKNTRSTSPNFITQMPVEYQSYVVDTKNVMADVISLMGFGEDNWVRVRHDLMNELSRNINLYAGAFLQEERVGEVLESLNCFTETARYKH